MMTTKICDRYISERVRPKTADGVYSFDAEMNLIWSRMTAEEKNKMIRYVYLLTKEKPSLDDMKEIMAINEWQCENGISTAVIPLKYIESL